MAHRIDQGLLTGWRPAAQVGWAAVLLVLMFFGVGSLVQIIVPDRHWFPKGAPERSLQIFIGAAVTLLVLVLFLPWKSNVQARVAASSIGIMLVLRAQLRPDALWNAGSTLIWRKLFGDRGTIWLCTGIGAAIAVGAWLARLA